LDISVKTIILVVLSVLLATTVWFTITRYFLQRAIINVVKMFREQKALNNESARSKEALGLKSYNPLQFKGLLDYKPTAFRILLRSGIIRISRDARGFFLSEESLAQTDLEPRQRR
jgi:hypothetical protein